MASPSKTSFQKWKQNIAETTITTYSECGNSATMWKLYSFGQGDNFIVFPSCALLTAFVVALDWCKWQ
jgi:hypothetical protein